MRQFENNSKLNRSSQTFTRAIGIKIRMRYLTKTFDLSIDALFKWDKCNCFEIYVYADWFQRENSTIIYSASGVKAQLKIIESVKNI